MLPQQARGTSRKHVAKHFTQDQPAAPDITCYIKQYVRLTSIAVISNFNVLGISKCKHVRAAIFSSQQSYGSNLKCPPAAFIGPLSQSVSQSWKKHSTWQKNAVSQDTFTPFTTRPANPATQSWTGLSPIDHRCVPSWRLSANSLFSSRIGFALGSHLLAVLCIKRKWKRKFSVLEKYISTTFDS